MKAFPNDPTTILGSLVLMGRCCIWITVYIPFLIVWAIIEEIIELWFRLTRRKYGN